MLMTNPSSLGEPRFASNRSHLVSDDLRIPKRIETGAEPGIQFELAGPRAKLFFDAKQTRAGIVTCGGLCPGLNNVIRSLVRELYLGYGVKDVLGFRGGYGGLDPDRGAEPLPVTPQIVDDIHRKGGTMLGTSRGPVDIFQDNQQNRRVQPKHDGNCEATPLLFLTSGNDGKTLPRDVCPITWRF